MEAVCADEHVRRPEVMLADLIDKSIVEIDQAAGRYRMLETLRSFGCDRLRELDEENELRRRHRAYYAALAEETALTWCGPNEVGTLQRIYPDWDNFRQAMTSAEHTEPETGLRIAVSLNASRSVLFLGLMDEGRRWLKRMLAVTSTQATPLRVKAVSLLALIANCQGQQTQAKRLVAEVLELAQEVNTPEAQAYALSYADGLSALLTDQSPRALDALTQAVDNARTTNDAGLLQQCLMLRALSALFLGDMVLARDAVGQCSAHAEAHGAEWALSFAWWLQGLLALWFDHDPAQATTHLQRALRKQSQIQDSWGILWLSEALAWAWATAGDPDKAGACLGAADRLQQLTHVYFAGLGPFADARKAALTQLRTQLGTGSYEHAYHHAFQAPDKHTALEHALGNHSTPPNPADGALTPRQREIALLIAKGLTDKEIADELVISPRTVESHILALRSRLDVRNRTEIATWVTRNMADTLDHET